MGSFLENVYDVLFHPGAAMRKIANEKLTGQAMIVFAVSALIPAGGMYFGLKTAGMAKFFDVAIVFHTVGSLAMWFIGAAVMHLIAELYGGYGSAHGLFAAMGFAHIPRVFAAPLWAITMVLPSGAANIFLAVSTIALMIWMLALDIAAIKGTYNLNGTKAVLVLITPFLAVIAAIAVIFIFAGTAFFPGHMG